MRALAATALSCVIFVTLSWSHGAAYSAGAKAMAYLCR